MELEVETHKSPWDSLYQPEKVYILFASEGGDIGLINVNDCPVGLGYWPRRVRALGGARNRKKATVKIQQNSLIRFISMILNFYFRLR